MTSWSPTGLITGVENSDTQWLYSYNAEGQRAGETLTTDNNSFEFAYTYNPLGHRDEVVYPDGKGFDLYPDDLGRPQQFGGVVFDIAYHPDGTVSQLEYGNGYQLQLPQTARQLAAGRLLTDSAGTPVIDLSFAYDRAANLVSVADATGWLHDRTLAYDGLHRLNSAGGYWGSGWLEYDALGNLTEKHIGGSQLSYQYDSGNRLLTVSGQSYAYDLLGNVLSDGLRQFTFNSASQLVSSDAQVGVSYAYDGNGRRTLVNRPEGTQVDVYDQAGQLVFSDQCVRDNRTVNYYHLGDELIAREESPCDSACH
jgi:YD repeat-containing protein